METKSRDGKSQREEKSFSERKRKSQKKEDRGVRNVKPIYDLGLPPTQDSSHHQDYYIFRIGNPNLNLHLPLASWVGGRPNI